MKMIKFDTFDKTIKKVKQISEACTNFGKALEILDKDNDLSRDSKVWQDAWKIPHSPLPYLIATNGVTGFAGPITATMTSSEVVAILQRIAGP